MLNPRDLDKVIAERLISENETLRTQLKELETLAYIGEHHFPDLTWKHQCQAETLAKLRLEGEVAHLTRQLRECHQFLAFVAHRPGSGGLTLLPLLAEQLLQRHEEQR